MIQVVIIFIASNCPGLLAVITKLEELLKFVDVAHHPYRILKSYTPTGSKFLKLIFLHDYWTKNFPKISFIPGYALRTRHF